MKKKKRNSVTIENEESGTRTPPLLERIKKKCALLAQSFLPSKGQLNDQLLQNRMKVCALAIALMWASSLRTAVYVSNFAINVPPLETVLSSCKSAVTVTLDERNKFSTCVDIQSGHCNDRLDDAIALEVERVDELTELNDGRMQYVQDSLDACIDDYTNLRRGLEGWVNELQIIPIHNETCTPEEREGMLTTVGDVNALKAEARAINVRYKRESRSTAQNVVEYARIRGEYDRAYMRRHADFVKNRVREYIVDKHLPTFPDIAVTIEYMRDAWHRSTQCTTVRPVHCREYWDYVNQVWKGRVRGMNDDLLDWYDEYQAMFLKIVDSYIEQYDELRNKVNDFNDKAMAAYKKAEEFYRGWYAYLRKATKDLRFATLYETLRIFVGWFREFMAIPLRQMRPLEIFVPGMPYYKVYYDRFNMILGINGDFLTVLWNATTWNNNLIWEGYYEWKDVQFLIKQRREHLISFMQKQRREILEKYVLPADYNPPQYIDVSGNVKSLEDEDESYGIMSEVFFNESQEAIESVGKAKLKDNEPNITLAQRVNFTAVKTKFSDFDISFERLRPPGIEIELWFLQIVSIGDLVFLIDHVFRIYFTIRLCFKYWDAGYIKLPQIDIRTQKERTNPFKFSNGRLFMYFITNPLIGALLGGLVFIWTAGLITAAYLPLYAEYRSGCIPSGGNGTFVSENIFTLAYNFAYNDGSSSLVKEIEHLDVKKTNTCSAKYTKTATKHNNDIVEYAEKSDSIQTVAERMDLFEQCIDTEIADAQFRMACCNETGYEVCENDQDMLFSCPMNSVPLIPTPFSPPGFYLSKDSCKMDSENSTNWELDEAIFDCSALPTCDITCKNPHREKIRKVTKECGCLVEWFFHAIWLRTILSLFIFIVLNVSRAMFLDGLARVIWRRLHPANFTVLATCDLDGEICTKKDRRDDDDASSQGQKVSSAISKKIDRGVYAFKVGGILTIIAAVSLNAIWVFLVFIAPDNTRIKWLLN